MPQPNANNSNRLALKPSANTPKNATSNAPYANKNKIAELADRLRLAKQKRDIIKGQNDRIAYGNSLRVPTEKDGVRTSRPIGL